MKTKHDIKFSTNITIPAGTPVIPATNLPDKDLFWAEPWPGMTEQEESWHRNCGFLVGRHEIE